MHSEPFTVVLTLRNANSIEQTTHVIDAPSEKEAVRAAFDYASKDYPNAKSAGEVALLGHVVFPGAHTPTNAFNEDPFDYEGQAHNVPDEEKGTFQAVVGGQHADQLAIMFCWLDRVPTWAIVAVSQEENSEEITVEPLYLRLTKALRRRVRSADGEPLEIEEEQEQEPVDPSLH